MKLVGIRFTTDFVMQNGKKKEETLVYVSSSSAYPLGKASDTPSSGYILEETGLGSIDSEVGEVSIYKGGSFFTGMRNQDREITLTIRPTTASCVTKFNQIIALCRSGLVRMNFDYTNQEYSIPTGSPKPVSFGTRYFCSCYVTKIDKQILSKTNDFTVTIKAPEPYFTSKTKVTYTYGSSDGTSGYINTVLSGNSVIYYVINNQKGVESFDVADDFKLEVFAKTLGLKHILVSDAVGNSLRFTPSGSVANSNDEIRLVLYEDRTFEVFTANAAPLNPRQGTLFMSVSSLWPILTPSDTPLTITAEYTSKQTEKPKKHASSALIFTPKLYGVR